MARGVKKIKMTSQAHYAYSASSATVKPDQPLTFEVEEWLPATSKEDKEKGVFWLLQTNDRKTILYRVRGKEFQSSFNKKLCGSYSYYLEASLSGKRDFKNSAGLYINGYTKPLIVKSEWRAEPEGSDIRKKPIAYGDVVYLWLETEGLNGDYISIEVYNNRSYVFDDTLMVKKSRIKVKEGEALYKIGDTNLWMSKVVNITDNEEFYIKVKNSKGQYILDANNDAIHARFLRAKNEMSSNVAKVSENMSPTKVFKPEVNAERFEPCRFNKLILTIPNVKDGKIETKPKTIFDNGKNLTNVKNIKERIFRSIYFKFNDYSISPVSQKVLNNILGFLLEHPGTKIEMNGFACVIGKEEYNLKLSQKRGDAVKDFFVKGGLDGDRIYSIGKGEYNIQDPDDYDKRNEEVYLDARRVDIAFNFDNHDANSIVVKTILPSSPKSVILDIENFEVKDCYRDKNKHENKIVINSPDAEVFNGSGSSVNFKAQSALAKYNPAPLQYIWPRYNLLEGVKGNGIDAAAIYNVHIHSCRYYSNKKNPTVKIKAYPDIKWTLKFFLNLTNDLAVTWKDQPASKHKELQKKAGKIGAENRWKQKDASFGFSLKAEWDINSSGSFGRNEELKQEYEKKFKKLFSLFSSIGDMSRGITKKTGGQIRNIGFKGVPIIFAIKPPNLDIQGIWFLEKLDNKLGTNVDISFNATPLIGLEMTIDLLCLVVGGVAGAFTGGTGAKPAMELYGVLKDVMNTGVDIGDDDFGFKASADVYIDLVISSTITTKVGFKFNTVGKAKDSKFALEATNTLKVEIKAGMWVKAEANLIIVKVEGYFEMSASGSAAITFGHGVNYDDKGLYYRPKLGFDGIIAEYVVKGKVGLSSKKTILWGGTPSSDNEDIIAQDKVLLVEPFDVIKSLEENFDFDANIPLITNP
ncbi:hypothetical protein GCM10022393_19340 [Aquimarina addita]|uniref:OmpA-like domain-containing protein n=1 Tax=Aquimarina addita TaxID=870485 RepID=A0ABP6UIE0_9FLAO